MAVGPYDPQSYWLVRFVFQRGLGLLYLLAFVAAVRQFRPLAGEDGLLPLAEYREHIDLRERPSLFYFFPDDRAVAIAGWLGVALSLLAVTGLSEQYGTAVSVGIWAMLWVLYQSFVNAGRTFYGFGWESMLLETGFLAIFLGASDVGVHAAVIWLLRWVLFRNMFGAGLIKLRGDDCWRDLTCMQYHYETQPMPNPLSWVAHHLPDRAHRWSVGVNHVVELVIPFLYFAPQPYASIAGAVTIAFMGWLMLTGNFAFLNALTMVLAVSTFSDGVLTALLSVSTPAVASVPPVLNGAVWLLLVVVLLLSYFPVRNLVSSSQAMNRGWDPLHLVNTYGAFGSITKTRYEVVVQGTRDEELTADTEWETYAFPGKPTDTDRRPPQAAPYHLRLDWQLWFAAMSPGPRRHPWFVHLLAKLLAADEGVRALLRRDPFGDDPPTHVRALRYRYRFTTPEERAETGDWWHRERVGTYYGPVSLADDGFRSVLRRRGWEVPDAKVLPE
ncbi:lipase maturation factor family protein [Haloarculaceae archaeon H-GB2-1]|nr:lipase maturation factor family protein [Haloarculaceae archaeon H-GB1-1]MEA5386976.1 lipase maturation factor family protein [Haloarculaceae archaeon H-GB11]MEA5408478.1 lipase maturation factor family protein [Haloarculaceae archaeon H-GB2-1]